MGNELIEALNEMRRAAFAGGWNAAMGAGKGLTFAQKCDEWLRHNPLPETTEGPSDAKVERVADVILSSTFNTDVEGGSDCLGPMLSADEAKVVARAVITAIQGEGA